MKYLITTIFLICCFFVKAQVIPVEQPQYKHPTKKTIVKKSITQGKTNNSISITNIPMVYVQGGSFNMGSNDNQDYAAKPVHHETVSTFYIGKYEVTQAQWKTIMGNNPSNFQNCNDCPVENVSWYDVEDFIVKLNQKTGKTYRLPTEAEWEFAAKGGKNSRGDAYSGDEVLYRVAWFADNSNKQTHRVGQKKANELGIYDMSGNVWEWCQDWFGADYYSNSPSENPQGLATGSFRVIRGASWNLTAQYCCVA